MDYSPLCQRPRFIHNQKTNPATIVVASNGAGPFAARNSSIFGQFSIRNPDGMYILRETATANITAISRSESLADRSVVCWMLNQHRRKHGQDGPRRQTPPRWTGSPSGPSG